MAAILEQPKHSRPRPQETTSAATDVGEALVAINEIGSRLAVEFDRLARARKVLDQSGLTSRVEFPEKPIVEAAWHAYLTPGLPPVGR